jgi:hypothetical protein
MNREFVAVATELQPLRSTGVYHAGMLPEGTKPLPEGSPFHLDPPVARKDLAVPVEGFVVGCFGKDQSPTHALVVNLDYRTYSGGGQPRREEFVNPVKRFIVGPGPLETFDIAISKWLPAESNRVELRLAPGGGVLVRVAD